MSNSVYATICNDRLNPDMGTTIMFLKRSNGEWWLPGGKILPQHGSPSDAIKWWVEKLTPLEEWNPDHIGSWKLSPEAGNHDVYLFREDASGQNFMRPRYTSSPLSLSCAWWNRYGIHTCLYKFKNMPWGQAKMAIYCLENLEAKKRANGEQLKDDLGEIMGLDWNRPK